MCLGMEDNEFICNNPHSSSIMQRTTASHNNNYDTCACQATHPPITIIIVIHNDCDWYIVCFPLIIGYAPIRLHGNGHVTLDLPYSFFYDLKVMKQNGGNDGGGPSIPGGKRRKRRQENVQETLQKVDLTFRPVEVGASVLLHSETERYIHQLMVSRVCKFDECSFKLN